VLKLKKDAEQIFRISVDNKNIDDLLGNEWLLTNNRGGYSSSTIACCNTRRYHGLLIGSLNPPASRIMALACCQEMVIVKKTGADCVFDLSTFEFSDKFAPEGYVHLKRFRRDAGVHFDYQIRHNSSQAESSPAIELTKSVYLLRNSDTVGLVYSFTKLKETVDFTIRPFIGLRDFHSLQKSFAPLQAHFIERKASEYMCEQEFVSALLIKHNVPRSCELLVCCPNAEFNKDQQWWFNFIYRQDKLRGQEFNEDLWTPGFFRCRLEKPSTIVLWANLGFHCQVEKLADTRLKAVKKDLLKHQKVIISTAESVDSNMAGRKNSQNGSVLKTLFLAADQFVSRCRTEISADMQSQLRDMPVHLQRPKEQRRAFACDDGRVTILAGFPWFADWGRDAFIALPGLLLATKRFREAKSVLINFACAADEGMIPNRFDDYSDTAHFNSIDASLWFIDAAFRYLNATSDYRTFKRKLLPTIDWIVESYNKGTKFGIRADVDGLITAGDESTQLTWMDAKYDGVAFTPRFGKAVEVNALWYSGLCLLDEFYRQHDENPPTDYCSMAKKFEQSFRSKFWNESTGYLNDCILPDGTADESLRPNQIFAVSLPFSPLPPEQQIKIVEIVKGKLLTPYGLRSLNTEDSRYRGRYTGTQQMRDQAYHQGTVWPYLIGHFIEAYLKVNNYSQNSKKEAQEFIKPLLAHLNQEQCLGQVSEIFDGDPPHKPGGCIAQAWSVGELIRAYQLIHC
jgi:glycogen debranching enzyme